MFSAGDIARCRIVKWSAAKLSRSFVAAITGNYIRIYPGINGRGERGAPAKLMGSIIVRDIYMLKQRELCDQAKKVRGIYIGKEIILLKKFFTKDIPIQ